MIKIGLEIHVELNTKSKMFCSCATCGSQTPNTRTCAVCLGHPGSKPVPNKRALQLGITIARMLQCKIASHYIFSRKSYFYPDLAKNYQITQYETPIGEQGTLVVDKKKIRIQRIHLEEDPAMLVHPKGIKESTYALVDYNRSGNPLAEIVTAPDIESAKQARDFLRELMVVLQYADAYDPAKHVLKTDANISIKKHNFSRVEIKNINGLKEIEEALSFEIQRQLQLKEKPQMHTRIWDGTQTLFMRSKESEEDYGYITDPDLVPINTKLFDHNIPLLPSKKAEYYIQQGVDTEDANVIAHDIAIMHFFDAIIGNVDASWAAKWVRRELPRVAQYNNVSVYTIDTEQFCMVLKLLGEKKISDKIAKELLEKLAQNKYDVAAYVKKENLMLMQDSLVIDSVINAVLKENNSVVKEYNEGKKEALNFLVGQVMRKTKGKVDAKTIKEKIMKSI